MRILITGSRGQLGRALGQGLAGHELILADVDQLDITRRKAVAATLDLEKPELVMNAAAYTQVDRAEEDAEAAFRVNAEGPGILAQETALRDMALLHVSTDYVFDGQAGRACSEQDAPSPVSVYGKSKLEGEKAVQRYNPRHYIVRTAWLYSVWGNNFPRTMLKLAKKGSVSVVSDQTGSPTYAPHLALGIRELIGTEDFGLRHMAGEGQASWYEFTCELYRLAGLKTKVVPVSTAAFPRPAQRPPFSALQTLRDPVIRLPPWQAGLAAFIRDLSSAPARH